MHHNITVGMLIGVEGHEERFALSSQAQNGSQHLLLRDTDAIETLAQTQEEGIERLVTERTIYLTKREGLCTEFIHLFCPFPVATMSEKDEAGHAVASTLIYKFYAFGFYTTGHLLI